MTVISSEARNLGIVIPDLTASFRSLVRRRIGDPVNPNEYFFMGTGGTTGGARLLSPHPNLPARSLLHRSFLNQNPTFLARQVGFWFEAEGEEVGKERYNLERTK